MKERENRIRVLCIKSVTGVRDYVTTNYERCLGAGGFTLENSKLALRSLGTKIFGRKRRKRDPRV